MQKLLSLKRARMGVCERFDDLNTFRRSLWRPSGGKELMSTDGRYAVSAGSKKLSPVAQTAFPLFRWAWGCRVARSHWANSKPNHLRASNKFGWKTQSTLFKTRKATNRGAQCERHWRFWLLFLLLKKVTRSQSAALRNAFDFELNFFGSLKKQPITSAIDN